MINAIATILNGTKMPEGDTIHRSAERLAPVLAKATILSANDNGRFVDAKSLVGSRFDRVVAQGKHLLMHLCDGRVLHSHMGMTGSWHTYQVGEPWRKAPRWAALSMKLESETMPASVAVCFSPKVLDLLSPTQFRRHPYLRKLGPDLMSDEFNGPEILSRFRIHKYAAVGEAVMNQTIVCGIGNVYKSEVLFLTGTDPFTQVQHLTDKQVLTIAKTAQTLMHKNRSGYPRRTRWGNDGQHLWAYGRTGQPCFRCENEIRMRRQGDLGRSTYWCRECQKPAK